MAGRMQFRNHAKFRRLRNFTTQQNFCCGPFSSVFCSSFLLALIFNVEFDLNSSCLDRLNNFGIKSLQKLQNLPQNAISRIVGTFMCKSG